MQFLEFHRDTFFWKSANLAEAQKAQTLPPSTMTLAGMSNHLAYVEDWWFSRVFAGVATPLVDLDSDPAGDWGWESWRNEAGDVLDTRLMAATERSRAIVRKALEGPNALDTLARCPEGLTGLRLRWVVVHMIEEYARHNGHADLLRESIDGLVGE